RGVKAGASDRSVGYEGARTLAALILITQILTIIKIYLFNTTSSMGRLTLNVLLSFAQFEREVIGERVRDKIAASKRKGIWVGGPVPLGYRSVGKKLEIVPEEAVLVRRIFQDYLRLGSIRELAASLNP